jgi:hypothetical protein
VTETNQLPIKNGLATRAANPFQISLTTSWLFVFAFFVLSFFMSTTTMGTRFLFVFWQGFDSRFAASVFNTLGTCFTSFGLFNSFGTAFTSPSELSEAE